MQVIKDNTEHTSDAMANPEVRWTAEALWFWTLAGSRRSGIHASDFFWHHDDGFADGAGYIFSRISRVRQDGPTACRA